MAVCYAIGESSDVFHSHQTIPVTTNKCARLPHFRLSCFSNFRAIVESGIQLKEARIPNPSSTDHKSGNQYMYLKFGIHRAESRIQDCLGLSCMGRFILVIANMPCFFDSILVQKEAKAYVCNVTSRTA